MFDRLNRLIDLGIVPGLTQAELRTTRFTNATVLIVLGYILMNIGLALVWGDTTLIVIQGLHFSTMAIALVLSSRGQRVAAAAWFAVDACVFVSIYCLVWGWESHTQFFLPMCVFLCFGLFDSEQKGLLAATCGLLIVAYLFVVFWFVGGRGPLLDLPERYRQVQAYGAVAGMMGLSLAFGYYSWRVVDGAERAAATEHARAERLLLNVLPERIAPRLKAGEEPIADRFDEVTVLFADVVGFTPMSAQMSPEESVRLLNEVFSAWDRICEDLGVEKIRTIGDGYMAVAGAPVACADHAKVLAQAALRMRDWLAQSGLPLQVRMGLNSGEAVGGVIGTTKFHYDLWGDAVNVAARMESHGAPGRIQIGPATRDRLGDAFACIPRGSIEVKGKGAMDTWWLES